MASIYDKYLNKPLTYTGGESNMGGIRRLPRDLQPFPVKEEKLEPPRITPKPSQDFGTTPTNIPKVEAPVAPTVPPVSSIPADVKLATIPKTSTTPIVTPPATTPEIPTPPTSPTIPKMGEGVPANDSLDPNDPESVKYDPYYRFKQRGLVETYPGSGTFVPDKTATTPTTPSAPDYTEKWGISPEKIDQDLADKKASIKAKYDLLRKEAAQKTESEKMSGISGLYDVGEVNPLSSGVGSISRQSEDVLNKRMDTLASNQAIEEAQAEAQAEGRKYEGAMIDRQAQIDEEARIQQEYSNERQSLLDSVEIAKTNRQFNQEDKDNALSSFSNLVSLGGSNAFEGYTAEDYAGLDKALGYKTGTTSNIATRIKELELKGESNIEKLSDGSVINWKQDKKGNWTYDELIKAPTQPANYEKVGDYLLNTDTGEWISSPKISGEAGSSGEQSQYLRETSRRTLQNVDELIPQVSGWTTGAGSLLSFLPETDAKYFRSQIDTLVSNITFGELVSMREASKTGGALGQVSDREGQLLGSALGALSDRGIKPEQYKEQLQKVKDSILTWQSAVAGIPENDVYEFMNERGVDKSTAIQSLMDAKDQGLYQPQSFSGVGSDTNKATIKKVISKSEGSDGGQCGRFVNNITNLGLGNSYQSKMAKMDKNITQPAPGMVFVVPYKDTGHTGFILGVNGDTALVKDSNYRLDEKISTHTIPVSSITGLKIV